MDSQATHPRSFSCEFFPPRDEAGRAQLRATVTQLAMVRPSFFSVTFGAGGSTRDGTYDTVRELTERGLTAAPHISGISTTRDEVRALLAKYRALGIERLVVLRGDRPKEGNSPVGDFRHASELVAFIRAETGQHFHLEVAAYPELHPESPTLASELRHFEAKIRAGANSAITQYFFNADAYCRFVDECAARGLDIAIVPGIMPITNYKQLARFSDACGAEIPRWIRKRLEGYGEDLESLRAFGLDVVTRLCEQLLAAGAPGLHFYTLNRAAATLALWERLRL